MSIMALQLESAHLDTQRQFYGETLGLPVEIRPDGALTIQAGRTQLTLSPAAAGTHPLYHFAFNIPENQFQAAKTWIAARVPLLKRNGQDEFDFEAWHAHAFYFADATGNILECIARHELPNASDASFGPAGFLEVGEIGLPGPTVAHVVDALADGPGLAIWSGDRENFAAVGEERALCIVVPVGRLWLPDDRIPAAPYPVALTLTHGQPGDYCLPDLPYRICIQPD